MLQFLKIGFQLLLLSVKLWEVEGNACNLLVVVYQLLLRVAVPQFGCVVAVVSMWITILSLRIGTAQGHRARVLHSLIQDPAYGLRRRPIPGTWVNKGKKKGRGSE